MSEREFELYLSLMGKLLRLGPEQTEAIADELRDHFDQRFLALCRQGVPREQAIRQALDEFGDAAGLATDFTQLARVRRRRLIMRCTLATVLLGAAALFVVQALTPPNAMIDGPPLARAQVVGDVPSGTLEIPEPAAPTTIDPATLVPPPLAKKLTWEFTDLPSSEMLAEFSRRVEMPLLVDEIAFHDLGVSSDEPVTDRLLDLPAYLLLDRLEDRLELGWYVDDGFIVVTSDEKAEEHLTLRSLVLTDLREQGYESDAVLELIQTVTGGNWEDIDGIGGTLTRVGDVIFVRQSDRRHREVAALLQTLRHHDRETYVLSPPVHATIREKLKSPISVEFDRVPLQTAISQFSDEIGIDIHIDEVALTDFGIPIDEPVRRTMRDKSAETVLRFLLQPLELTAFPELGRLLITTTEVAEARLQVVLHDVSDVCESKDQTEQLSRAILNETDGPWEDIDGVGGVISVPVSGIMVVRQTEKQLQEVRELLAAYRQAVDISGPQSGYSAEMEKTETRYYHMSAETARDLKTVLPRFVKPGTWFPLGYDGGNADFGDRGDGGFGGGGGSNPDWVGEISIVAIDPKIEKLPGRAVSDEPQENNDFETDESPTESQPDVLVTPQAVLIITHTRATHREIDRFLKKVRRGDTHALRGGGIGGFYQVPDHPAER